MTQDVVQEMIDKALIGGFTKLDLSKKYLKYLPIDVLQLTNITELYLENNQLTTLPPEIVKLQKLTSLYLGGNMIKTLPSEIGELTDLTWLDLGNNQLTTLPPEIVKLQKLTSLYLGGNKLTTLPREITKLRNLTWLDLGKNQLTTLPREITNLRNLTRLDLGNNRLTTLPREITNLRNLVGLDLVHNQLTTLPPEIVNLRNLSGLELEGNPLTSPPLEIVYQGIQSIHAYFRQREMAGTDYLYEAKLLIVGEAGAGKTTLAQKIKNPRYELQEEDSTKGIEVTQWHFPFNNRTFQVNIWDFGGQEIYHSTHQFFLTKRSVYALVADIRKEDTDFYYWLNIVELLSGNSPVLVIKNEKQDRQREINERQLRGQFTNLKATLATDLATNRGLATVLDELQHYLGTLPHVGDALPTTWKNVRAVLENEARDYISLSEFLTLCNDHGFTRREDAMQLSEYLHDLGICLHFQNDALLNKTVFLKPAWGTKAVYRVLDHPDVQQNYGRFTRADLTAIWHEDTYTDMHDELLRLMINFKLCYPIPGSQDMYIAPQLLTEAQPDYVWDANDNLQLRYKYEFMPKGIITRFIVEMHPWIFEHRYVWRTGVILEKDNTQAEVIEYYNKREITIRVVGHHKKDLLTIITYELDKIHDSFHHLKCHKLIPCNCQECKNSSDPEFYEMAILKRFILDRQPQIQCRKSYVFVSAVNLIDDVLNITADDSSLNSEAGSRRQSFEDMMIEAREQNNSATIYHIDTVIDSTFSTASEVRMSGDKYTAGQAGAQGPGAHAHDITFNQRWSQAGDVPQALTWLRKAGTWANRLRTWFT